MHERDLQNLARRKLATIERARKSARFRRVIGKLQQANLIFTNTDVEHVLGPLPLADFLWAGEIEPRVYELLPALILKKPSFFRDLKDLPEDLSKVLASIRKGLEGETFRGIPAQSYCYWVERIGHRGKTPSVLKTFRLKAHELRILREASERGMTETDAVRRGLELLAQSFD